MRDNAMFSEDDIDQFKEDGFIVVRGFFDKNEMQELYTWTSEVEQLPEIPGKYMMYFEESLTVPKKRILSRVENFCAFHEGFFNIINGPKMLGACSELFGSTAVLFKEKINFKLPGASGFTPHQDVQAGWGTYAKLHITAMVSIDPTTIENGCLELAAGCHMNGLLGQMLEPLSEKDLKGVAFRAYPTEPGDAMFFDSYAPHRSAANHTNKPRRVLYTTYNRLSDGDHLARYYADKRKSYPPDCERDPNKDYSFKV